MDRVLFSFLGTNPYIHCRYQLEDKCSPPVRYVQEALANFLCTEWQPADRIYILGTPDGIGPGGKVRKGSISENWLKGSVHSKDNSGMVIEPSPQGLKGRLAALPLQCNVQLLEIPDAMDSGDLWHVIRILIDHVQEKDEIYFDITHSFRFLPMVVPTLISFVKRMKQATLGEIYYGAFECLGFPIDVCSMEMDRRIAPIRPLREIYEMGEWSEAVQSFVDNGDERPLVSHIKSAIDSSSSCKAIRRFFELLGRTRTNVVKMGESMRLTNVAELKDISAEKIEQRIPIDEKPELYPMMLLYRRIQEVLSQWTDDDIQNGYLAAKWCLEHQRLAQSMTFAYEASIGFLCKQVQWDAGDRCQRSHIGFLVNIRCGRTNKDGRSAKISDVRGAEEEVRWFKTNAPAALVALRSLDDSTLRAFMKLGEWRNAVNHAKKGDRSEMSAKFPDVLAKLSSQYEQRFSPGRYEP